MQITEPLATATLLLTVGVLLFLSVLFSRAGSRVGVPVFLVFLSLGMLAGSEGLGGILFEDYHLSFRIGVLALALILFDGGLNTPVKALRSGLLPAAILATLGVAGTALLVAVCARLLGFPWILALLLGAVVSSTDAAAVFSVLRGSGLQLKRRLGITLELESGLNDPLAVILTTALVDLALGRPFSPWLLLAIPAQLVVGAAVGLACGLGGRWALRVIRVPAGGLYAVLLLSVAFASFGLATLSWGSGFLAVYVAGVVVGNGSSPYRTGLLRFHDAMAWLSQVAMFLILGLLVFPSRLLDVAAAGLALSLALTLVARPAVVALCLRPLGYDWRQTFYVGWVGLRGAVPIVLATIPVMGGVPGAGRLFDVVFFVVVVSALVPGGTVPWVTRRLGFQSDEPPPPAAALDITSLQPLGGEILGFAMAPEAAACGARIADLPLPEGSHVMLIVRGEELVAPKGKTVIQPGDHVYVFGRPSDLPLLGLLFGRRESQ